MHPVAWDRLLHAVLDEYGLVAPKSLTEYKMFRLNIVSKTLTSSSFMHLLKCRPIDWPEDCLCFNNTSKVNNLGTPDTC